MIEYKGRQYTPEEVIKLPAETQRAITKMLSAEEGHPAITEVDMEEGYIINDDMLAEEDYTPNMEYHNIKNPKAAVMFERLIASDMPHDVAMERVKDLFKRDLDKKNQRTTRNIRN